MELELKRFDPENQKWVTKEEYISGFFIQIKDPRVKAVWERQWEKFPLKEISKDDWGHGINYKNVENGK